MTSWANRKMSSANESSQLNSRATEELLAGIKTGILHISWYASWLFDRYKRGISNVLGINDKDDDNKSNSRVNLDSINVMNHPSEVLQVVGVGYGRTGTVSNRDACNNKAHSLNNSFILSLYQLISLLHLDFFSILWALPSPNWVSQHYTLSTCMKLLRY